METYNIISFLVGRVLPVTLATTLLFVCYSILLHRSNRFQLNRIILLSMLIFSFAMPLIRITPKHILPYHLMTTQNLVQYFTLDEVVVSPNGNTFAPDGRGPAEAAWNGSFNIWDLLLFIYLAGVALFGFIFLSKLLRIVFLIAKSEKTRDGKYWLVKTHKEHIPYSFLNYIFLPEGETKAQILIHEKSHVNHGHTYDILYVELLKIVQWFNPIIGLYKKELQNLHEYAADHDVIESGAKKTDYLTLILQQCTAVNISTIGNNFSLSLTKKRIKMMTQKSKTKGMIWKTLLVLPVMMALLAANSYAFSDNQNQANKPKMAESLEFATNNELDSIYKLVDQMPEFPGGTKALTQFNKENIKYPENSKANKIEGQVFATFVIEKDGSISNIKVLRNLNNECDAEVIRAIRAMPKWKPGYLNGKPVRVEYVMPFEFKLSEENTKSCSVASNLTKVCNKNCNDFTAVDQMPEFPGGTSALMKYLSENTKYPEEAIAKNISGRVLVSFTVETDGTISDVKIIRSSGKELDNEALRVVKAMPKWKPGENNGQVVRVAYNLPITFKIPAPATQE